MMENLKDLAEVNDFLTPEKRDIFFKKKPSYCGTTHKRNLHESGNKSIHTIYLWNGMKAQAAEAKK